MKVDKDKIDFAKLLNLTGKIVWRHDEWQFFSGVRFNPPDHLEFYFTPLGLIYDIIKIKDIAIACNVNSVDKIE